MSTPESHQRRLGRPPGSGCIYTDELADEIVERLTIGELLSSICRDERMPGRTTIEMWLRDPAMAPFAERIARARQIGCDAIAEDCFKIADDESGDILEDFDGRKKGNNAKVARSKLRIETRMALLQHWSNKYKQKQVIDLPPGIRPGLSQDDLAPLSKEARREFLELCEKRGIDLSPGGVGK